MNHPVFYKEIAQMTTYLPNGYLSAILCNFMWVGHQKRTVVSENLQKIRTTGTKMLGKYKDH